MERVEWTQFEQEIEDLRRAKYGHDHADIVPVETEEDQRHRQEFLAQNRLIKVKKTHQLVQKPIIEESKIMNNSCGKMDVICQFCGAIHFKGELASCKKFNICCSKGKLVFPPPLHRSAQNCFKCYLPIATLNLQISSKVPESTTMLSHLHQWEHPLTFHVEEDHIVSRFMGKRTTMQLLFSTLMKKYPFLPLSNTRNFTS